MNAFQSCPLSRRLADANCTEHEIMAVLGHTMLAKPRDSFAPDQVRQASSAIIKLKERNRNGMPKPSLRGLGKIQSKQLTTRKAWRPLGDSNPCFSRERAAS